MTTPTKTPVKTPTKTPVKRTDLVTLAAGKGTRVRVFKHVDTAGRQYARVQDYVGSLARTKDYPFTTAGIAQAKAHAQRLFARKTEGSAPTLIRVDRLWEKYTASAFAHLGPKTKANYTEQWGYFVAFTGERFVAEKLTHERLDEFVTALRVERKSPLSVRVVRDVLATVKRVYRWAEGRELLAKNRAESYRYTIAKAERATPRDEFTPAERDQLLSALDPHSSREWRAWVALSLCGYQGARQIAVLHLQWDDLTVDGRDVIWRAAWDKNGAEWVQQLRRQTRDALRVALTWREHYGYTGPWVLFAGAGKGARTRKGGQSETYTIQALYAALRKAQARAGIERKIGRGGHGLRKTVAGDVRAITGDAALGVHAIGDRDLKMGNTYLRPRLAEIRAAFDRLDGMPSTPDAMPIAETVNHENTVQATNNENGAPQESAPSTSTDTTTYANQ